MSRLEIAKKRMEFRFSDQEYMERRIREYRKDSEGKVDMRMTTVSFGQTGYAERTSGVSKSR